MLNRLYSSIVDVVLRQPRNDPVALHEHVTVKINPPFLASEYTEYTARGKNESVCTGVDSENVLIQKMCWC